MGVSESRLGCQPGLSGWSGGGKVIGSFQETRCRGERGERRQMRRERRERREEEDARFLGKFHQWDLESGRGEAGGIGGFLS